MLLNERLPCPRQATKPHRCQVLLPHGSGRAALRTQMLGVGLLSRVVKHARFFSIPLFSSFNKLESNRFAGDALYDHAPMLWHWWAVTVPDPNVALGRPRRRPVLCHHLSQLPLRTTSLSLFTKSFGVVCDGGVQAIITGARAASRGLVCFFRSRALCSAASVSLLIIQTFITTLYLWAWVLVYISLKPPALVALGGGFLDPQQDRGASQCSRQGAGERDIVSSLGLTCFISNPFFQELRFFKLPG